MGFLNEFKKFISRGNVMDLAVGVIIGTAFGKIVTSLVNDVIMPPFGLLFGKVNFKDLYINLSGEEYASLADAKAAGAATLNYGAFLNTILEFLIIGFAVFLMIRWINRMEQWGKRFRAEDAKAEPTTKECPQCTTVIPIRAKRCPACTSTL